MKALTFILPALVFAVAAAAMFPLRMAWAAAAPSGLFVTTLEGSVWSGSLTGVSWRGLSLGDFETSVSPMDLLPQPAVRLSRGTGLLKSALLRADGDTLDLREADIRVELNRISPHLPREVIARITNGAIVMRAGACLSAAGGIATPAAPSVDLPAFTGVLSCERGALVAHLASNLGDVELVASGTNFATIGWRGASPALAIALIAAGLPAAAPGGA